MSFIFYKITAGFLIFLTSLIAVIYPIKVRAHPEHHPLLESADAFASGIFLGAALFHMLPNAIAGLALLGYNEYPFAELWCAGGFLILLFLERLSEHHALPYMLALILIVHALIEGAVLGMNTTLATAAVIFLAIIAHKGSESFALAVILNKSILSLRHVIIIIAVFSLMTPLGIVFGNQLARLYQTGALIAGFNAFAAGTFLYISTLHHINHHERSHESEGVWESLFLLIGLVIMALLAVWALF